jgi:hypothetical protein
VPGESFLKQELDEQLSRNQKLIETILRHGGKLDEERPIDFFFYCSTEESARDLGLELAASGFVDVNVADEPLDDQWSVTAVKIATIDAVTDPLFVERLVKIASNALAEFDGWGTPL